MPRISVVLPVHNGADTIVRAVRSILGQTLTEIELIVLDDGSTDSTMELVEQIEDSRLRLVRIAHSGVATACNTATDHAVAPFIARMDADDISHPTRLEKQLEMIETYELDVVGTQVRIVDTAGKGVPSMQRYERWINEETLLGDRIQALRFVELPVVNPTILARRDYFTMGFRNNSFPEDYDLMLRAAARGYRFGKVDSVLFDWIEHSDRLTRTDRRYSQSSFLNCRQQHLIDGPLSMVKVVDIWGVGRTGKPWLRWLQGKNVEVRNAWDINHRKVGEMIHGVRVRHPSGLPPADGTPLLVAVGAENARDLIAPQIESRGYISGEDAWFVA